MNDLSNVAPTTLADRVAAATALLARVGGDFAPVRLAFSGGAEDVVLLDLAAKAGVRLEPFLLDTGRLHPETLALVAAMEARYRLRIAVLVPEAAAVEHYVRLNGINGFYESVAQRRDCCGVRKVAPLKRALAGAGAWVTGQRREQSPTRGALAEAEWDAGHQLDKFNPLAAWTADEVWDYVRAHEVPVNALHARGYPSIGCAPCTRAVGPGEDARAGRWWWEDATQKECGLHPAARQTSVAAGAERA